ncbi:MAG: tRNA threonylcarbamoyladenosine dehydratase [Clostridia bacterium]|nr:tRNA threonylcarbamoyladenosine dehydratase [Clostridia bacterium]
MSDSFARTRMLFGPSAMERLAQCRVAVFGLGGVGCYAVEALARSGIGALDLIDHDCFSQTNLNRQLYATQDTIGQFKAEVAAERIRRINPDCRVTVHRVFYLPETRDMFDFTKYDYIVDAIDTVTGKLALAKQAQESGTPIISAMGTGNKLDPTALQVGDIHETSVCPLARVMRSECRRRGIDRLKVVYSTEPPRRSLEPAADAADNSARRDIPGSTAFVPAAAGLILAAEVVKDLIEDLE